MKQSVVMAVVLLSVGLVRADERWDRFSKINREFLTDGRPRDLTGVVVETKAVKKEVKAWTSADGRKTGVLVTNGDAQPQSFTVEAPGWFYAASEPSAWAVKRDTPVPAGTSRIYLFLNPPTREYSVAADAPVTLKPEPALGYMRGGYDGLHYRYRDILKGLYDGQEKGLDCVWLGDSITHFWQAGGKDAVAREQLYKRKFGNCRILNAGMGGITVQQLLWNIVYGGFLDGCRTRFVTVMIGANNVWNESPEDIAKGIAVCLKEIRARQPQAKVLLMSMLPLDVRARYDEKKAKAVAAVSPAVNKIIRTFADGQTVLWIDLHDKYVGDDGWAKKELFNDGTHPSVAGYEIWADAILPYLTSDVKATLVANPETQAWPASSFLGKPFWPLFAKLSHTDNRPVANKSGEMCWGLEDLPLTQEYATCLSTHGYLANVRRYNFSREKDAAGKRIYCELAPAEGRLLGSYTLRDIYGPGYGDYLYTGDWKTRRLWNPQEGRPFTLDLSVSRPCFFLDGEDRGDKADFAKWQAAHPNFLGFYAMGEIDSDSGNYRHAMLGIGGRAKVEGEIRKDFEQRFPLWKDRYDFLRFMRQCWDTEVKFHFGVDKFWPLYCNNHTLAHINAKMGAVGLQAEISSSQGSPWTWSGAYTRGASRQWGLPFSWYCATFYRGFTRNAAPGSDPVAGDNKWPRDGRHTPKRPAYHGASVSLTARQKYYGWLIGAGMIQDEPWTMLCTTTENGVPGPSPYAKVFNDVFVRSQKIDRGAPLTPVALLTPLTECMSRGGYVSGEIPGGKQTDLLNLPAYVFTLQPVHETSGKYPMLLERRRKGDEGCLFNSPFGEIWDVLTADAGMASGKLSSALAHYPAAFLIGTYRKDDLDVAALETYVKGGGTLFLSADYVADGLVSAAFAGVAFGTGRVTSGAALLDENGKTVGDLAGAYELYAATPAAGTQVFLKDEKGNPVAFARPYGRGRVVTTCCRRSMPAFFYEKPYRFDDKVYNALRQRLLADDAQLDLIRYLLDRVQAETIPVAVEGDIQWGVNKVERCEGGEVEKCDRSTTPPLHRSTQSRWLVWLINNKGIAKFVGEPADVDPSKAAKVRIAPKGKGKWTVRDADTGEILPDGTVTVGPGDVRFVTVEK